MVSPIAVLLLSIPSYQVRLLPAMRDRFDEPAQAMQRGIGLHPSGRAAYMVTERGVPTLRVEWAHGSRSYPLPKGYDNYRVKRFAGEAVEVEIYSVHLMNFHFAYDGHTYRITARGVAEMKPSEDAVAANGEGDVVVRGTRPEESELGWVAEDRVEYLGVLHKRSGETSPIPRLRGVMAMNAKGDVVGREVEYEAPDYDEKSSRPGLFDGHTTVLLDAPEGSFSRADDINDRGVIVGHTWKTAAWGGVDRLLVWENLRLHVPYVAPEDSSIDDVHLDNDGFGAFTLSGKGGSAYVFDAATGQVEKLSSPSLEVPRIEGMTRTGYIATSAKKGGRAVYAVFIPNRRK